MTPQDLKDLVEKNDNESNAMIIEYFKDNDIYDICFPHGENILHFAAGYNNAVICNYLINEKHIIINLTNARGATPLYYAVLSDCCDVVNILLYNGADPRIRSGFSGMFPYQIAKSNEIATMLGGQEHMVPLDYDNNCVKKEQSSLYHTYRYRLHRYWLTVLTNAFLQKNNIKPIEGVHLINESDELLSNGGFSDVLENYKHIFVNYMFNLEESNETSCLYCNAETNTKKCTKCKSVYFCNKQCQEYAYFFHKMDCKTK